MACHQYIHDKIKTLYHRSNATLKGLTQTLIRKYSVNGSAISHSIFSKLLCLNPKIKHTKRYPGSVFFGEIIS